MCWRFVNIVAVLLLFLSLTGCKQDITGLLHDKNGQMAELPATWKLLHAEQNDEEFSFVFSGKDQDKLEITCQSRDDSRAFFTQSRSFNIIYKTRSDRTAHPESKRLIESVADLIKANDDGSFTFSSRDSTASEDAFTLAAKEARIGYRDRAGPFSLPTKIVIYLLLAFSLFGLLKLALLLMAEFGRLGNTEKRLWLVALIVGLSARTLAPAQMVQLYSGYGNTSDAVWFDYISGYGGAWFAFYHLLFQFLPNDHAIIQAVNMLIASATIVIFSLIANRYMKIKGMAAAVAWILALAPIFIKDANTESMLILALAWFFAALWFLDSYIENSSLSDLIFFTCFAALAFMARPFMAILPLIALVLALGKQGGIKALWIRKRPIVAAFAAVAILVLPNFLNTWQSLGPNPFPYRERLLDVFSGRYGNYLDSFNLLFAPTHTPTALLMMLLTGAAFMFAAKHKRKLAALVAASFLFFMLYTIDQPPASMPRLQIPSQYFILPIMGAGLLFLLNLLPGIARRNRTAAISSGVLFALLFACSFSLPLKTLWKPDNSIEEERFIRLVEDFLPENDFALVRRGLEDEPRDFVDVAFPDYLFTPPKRKGAALEIAVLLRNGKEVLPTRRVYYFEGTRCFAQQRHDESRYHKPGLHPQCKAMHDKFHLKPVLTREKENHFETYHRYPQSKTLKFSLYEVGDRK